jgi:predicted DNA-binding protein (MmcQ/YjbR family)
MDIEWLRKISLSLPGTAEDIKWGNDLCFTVATKMFCVAALDAPHSVAFKVPEDDFDEMIALKEFIPAPYMARAKWVKLHEPDQISKKELERYIIQSYDLVKKKLPMKTRKELGI